MRGSIGVAKLTLLATITDRKQQAMGTYALIDDLSHNILGEFPTRVEAELLRAELIVADSSATEYLRIEEDSDVEAPQSASVATLH